MKYGDTLRQRSIPEWGHYNLDYHYLKDLIKQNTTPGAGTAVSIPGQGATTERAFGATFFAVLCAQHDRINLFVKSKSGEIERRLDYIGKQLAQIQARKPQPGADGPLSAKAIERYAKVDNDIAKAGEEIRSLSRFRAAQCTGFHKILKKYKRWTGDRSLEQRFKKEVTGRKDSFYQLDLGYLLDQYIDVLGTLRAILESSNASGRQGTEDPPSPASKLHRATQAGSAADFDVALSTVPLGPRGSRATYWVHPDHVVEVEILLLQQQMRVVKDTSAAGECANGSSTIRSTSSGAWTRLNANEDNVGLVVLDHEGRFAQKQNTRTIDEETAGAIPARGDGNAWWTPTSLATVAVGIDTARRGAGEATVARVKRKHLEAILTRSLSSPERTESSPTGTPGEDTKSAEDAMVAVKQWLARQKDVKPIASICSKRARFVGMHNGTMGGLWASIDRDIFMKDSLPQNLDQNDGRLEDPTGLSPFPHAVLEIRREGTQSVALINMLDRSHLVERVRGFSLETHAVWTTRRPPSMSQPTWIPLLNQDIRKLPQPAPRRGRTRDTPTPASTALLSPGQTSTTATSATSATSPYPSHAEETSASELMDPPSLRDFRKKRRTYSENTYTYSDNGRGGHTTTTHLDVPQPQRYWNEYDNPEDSDDGGYYIYVDPNAEVKFPGQETLENWVRKTKSLLWLGKEKDGRSPSLSATTEVPSSDEETVAGGYGYGTMHSVHPQLQPQHGGAESLFSSLFRPPHADADVEERSHLLPHAQSRLPYPHAAEERQALLALLSARQRERETTAFHLYTSCLLFALILNAVLTILTNTSRRKMRGEVDTVVILGIVCNFLLVLVGVSAMLGRKELVGRLGWWHYGAVSAVAVACVVWDAVLLRWAVVV